MTDARASQVVTEVLRTNLAVTVDVSQLPVEVLRPNGPMGFAATAGAYTLTGEAAAFRRGYLVHGATGAFNLTGENAGSKRTYIAPMSVGSFTLTGVDAQFKRPGKLLTDVGVFTLTGQDARQLVHHSLAVIEGAYTFTGQSTAFVLQRRLSAAPGAIVLTGVPTMKGIFGLTGAFTLTGKSVSSHLAQAAEISEIVQVSDPPTAKWTAHTTTADRTGVADRSQTALGLTLASTIAHTDTLTSKLYRITTIIDAIRTSEICTPTGVFRESVIDPIAIADAIGVAFPSAISDSIAFQDTVKAAVALLILERLALGEVSKSDAKFSMALVDAIYNSDSLARFLDGAISDTWSFAETVAPAWRLPRAVTDLFNVTDAAAGKMLVRITAVDGIELTAEAAARWIFAPTVTDNVEITIGYIAPDGDFTTWAVNTRTGAVTEYQNFTFNSFAQFGHKYLGTSSSGLYELDGNTDAGSDIIAQIKSGYAQFGGSKYSSFKAAYLGMRGNGDIIFKLDTGDGKSYTYQTVIQDMQSTKVRLGKGLRARYFAFELISTGQDFDLDTIEFIPLVAQRRV